MKNKKQQTNEQQPHTSTNPDNVDLPSLPNAQAKG